MKQIYFLNYKTLLPLIVLLTFLNTNISFAQCGPYQCFESFKTVTIPGNTYIAPVTLAFSEGVASSSWYGHGLAVSTVNAYSGIRSINLTTAYSAANTGGYIITPKITSLKDFSFWYKNVSGTLVDGLIVQYSYNYSGGDPTAATWNSFTGNALSFSTATYAQFTFDFSTLPLSGPVNIRIARTSTSAQGIPQIDDVAWTSTVTDENLEIIAGRGASTTCTHTLLNPLLTYVMYDNGGSDDVYSTTQVSTVTVVPPAGYAANFTFPAGLTVTTTDPGTCANTDYLQIFNGTSASALMNRIQTGCPSGTVPGGTLLSTDCLGRLTAVFNSDASAQATTAFGYKINVTMTPTATCADVINPVITAGLNTYDGATVTWTAPCPIPNTGYDYYTSTVNSMPGPSPGGVITVPNSSPSATITGLTSPNTTYYVWIRSNCGGSTGNWIPASTGFTTICAPIAVPPTYTVDFEGSGSIPTCTSTTSGSSGIGTLAGNNYFFNTSAGTWFFTNPLTLDPTKIYRLSFDYSNSASQATTVQAYYGATNYSPSAAVTTSLLTSVSTSSATVANSRSYFQPSGAGPYYIGIKLNSIAGGSLKLDNIILEVVPCFPADTPVISGPSSPCPSITATYTATPTPSAVSSTPTSYTWTVPTGWVITAGQGTSSIQVTTSVMTGNITAMSNLTGCDSSVAVNYAVSAAAIPGQPSTITGSTAICNVSGSYTYSVTAVAGVTYNWSFPASWGVSPGTGNSVTVTPLAGATSGTISVTPMNAGGCAGTPRSMSVIIGSVTNTTCATAATITSTISDTFRCNQFNMYYAFTAICTGNHKFTLTGSATDIDLYAYGTCPTGTALGSGTSVSNSESFTISLTAGTTYYIRVLDYTGNNSGTSSGGNFTLSVASTAIGSLGAISGSSSVSCSSVTETTYSISPVAGATTYTWTIPASWTLEAGQGSTSIDISTDGSSTGTISVIASGPCGTSTPATLVISLGQITPGAITGATGLCTSTANTTYSIAAVEGAISYTWSLPPGWSFVGASNTISVTVTPSTAPGTVSVTATGPCGTSPASTLAVTTAPAVTSTGIAVCQGGSGSLTATLNTVNTFTIPDIVAGNPTYIRTSTLTGTPTVYTASGTSVRYVTQTITTNSVGGAYTFAGCAAGDSFLQIYQGSFNPASPATNYLVYDDDSNNTACTLDPLVTITLAANTTYILVYSTWSATATTITGINLTVTPPTGGGVTLGSIEWYNAANVLLGTGSSFDPVGVTGSGLVNTATDTPGAYTFYATNSVSSFCKTATVYTLNAKPTVTIPTVPPAVSCSGTITTVTVTGTATTYTWTSTVANTLYSNATATTLYVAGTNASTVYVKTSATATITATGIITATGCSNTANITFTISTKTWTGGPAWIGGTPTSTDSAIIAGNYSNGSFTACSCTVNSGAVVFNSGETMTLQNELYQVGGTVTFNNGSSLVQVNTPSTNTNTGNITYNRVTSMRKFDYTYWSSPVDLQIIGVLSPGTLSDKYFWFNTTTYLWQNVAVPGTTPMDIARGYIIRGPQSYDPVNYASFTGTFVGKPNNGDYSIAVANGGVNHNLNCIGNPYPSAISADSFILQNTSAFGSPAGTTLYFWTHNSNMVNNQYLDTDYATYNFSGGTGTGVPYTSPSSPFANNSAPNGYIAAGQAFMAKGTGAASTTVTFKNNMRVAGNNTLFFRTNGSSAVDMIQNLERNRVWLDLQNEAGNIYKQILVGYIENATDSYDNGFDGDVVEAGNRVSFYSLLDDKKLSIQGMALPFNDSDVIPLGYRANNAGAYKISLSQFDGVFDNQQVYLEDKLLNVIHPLKTGPYSFVTDAGTFDTRFALRFIDTLLAIATPEFNENAVVAIKQNNEIQVRTSNIKMKSAQLYDIRGRLIAEKHNLDSKSVVFSGLNLANQVLIVNITSEDGVVVSKKIVY
jgi:hypothetical protein